MVSCFERPPPGRMSAPRAFMRFIRLCTAMLPLCAEASGPRAAASGSVTIDEIAAGIQQHIAAKSHAEGGYFRIKHDKSELKLQLVRVHLEYLADLGGGVHFACVDMVGTDGPVYDVDFFLKGPAGAMAVTATSAAGWRRISKIGRASSDEAESPGSGYSTATCLPRSHGSGRKPVNTITDAITNKTRVAR